MEKADFYDVCEELRRSEDFKWSLTKRGKRLRGHLIGKPSWTCCPVTAYHYLKTGKRLKLHQTSGVFDGEFGIACTDAVDLIKLADNDHSKNLKIPYRKRGIRRPGNTGEAGRWSHLLRSCDVEEVREEEDANGNRKRRATR